MNRWAKQGVLEAVFAELQRQHIIQVRVEPVSLDRTIIPVHPDGTGAVKKRPPMQSSAYFAGSTTIDASLLDSTNSTSCSRFSSILPSSSRGLVLTGPIGLREKPAPAARIPQRHLWAIAQLKLTWHPPCSFHDHHKIAGSDRSAGSGPGLREAPARQAARQGYCAPLTHQPRRDKARWMSRENGLAVPRAQGANTGPPCGTLVRARDSVRQLGRRGAGWGDLYERESACGVLLTDVRELREDVAEANAAGCAALSGAAPTPLPANPIARINFSWSEPAGWATAL